MFSAQVTAALILCRRCCRWRQRVPQCVPYAPNTSSARLSAAQATAALLPALLPVAAGRSYSAGVQRRALAIVHSLMRTVSDTLGDDPRTAAALAPLLQPWWPALQAALREPTGVHVRGAQLFPGLRPSPAPMHSDHDQTLCTWSATRWAAARALRQSLAALLELGSPLQQAAVHKRTGVHMQDLVCRHEA